MNSSSSVFTTRVVNMGYQKKKKRKKKVKILYHPKTLHYFFVRKHMEETGNIEKPSKLSS